jgi:serine phosphatase RsbU (regulator of sigma subunit)
MAILGSAGRGNTLVRRWRIATIVPDAEHHLYLILGVFTMDGVAEAIMATQCLRVLLIEDDSDDVASIAGFLREMRGVQADLTHVTRLSEGLARLAEGDVDVVLLDLMLLDQRGLDTFRELHARSPGMPVVVMTALDSEEIALEAVREGAQDYLFKSAMSGSQLGRTIRYALERAHSSHVEQEFLATQRELSIAQQIQEGLYPQFPPAIPGYDIAGASFPAKHVGGDYYDFLDLADHYLGIAIGDASGHGVGAALVSAETRALLRALVISHHSVDEIITLANRVLTAGMKDTHFITLFLARLNPRTGSFVYTSAGHETGRLLNAAGGLKAELKSTGIPLGVMADCEFPISVGVKLAPGDIVILPTDGIREARSGDNEFFGNERLINVVRTNREKPAREIIATIETAVREHCHPHPPPDDFSVVILKVNQDIVLAPSFGL